MTPRQYLDIVRAHWRLVVAGLLVGLLTAGAIMMLTPRRYAADASIYLMAQTPPGDAGDAKDGGDLIQQRMTTYTEMLTSDRLADEVARQLGGAVPAATIHREIIATSSPDSALITATVTDRSPQLAAQIANTAAERFAATVIELERAAAPAAPPLITAQTFQPARPPTSPVSPDPVSILLLGGLLGLAAGCVAAGVRHVTDTSVKAREQVRSITGVPVIGSIGTDAERSEQPLAVRHDPSGRVAEAFRRLRTNLQFLDVDRSCTVWLVTSPTPGVGKTTVVANLAAVMADAGGRVLVIEADLRRPRIAEMFGVDRSIGLTNVLIRRMPGRQAVQHVHPGLDVLTSGPLPPNPSEILGSAAMAGMLAQARERYDVVLIDASPLSPVTDAVALAPQADGVLLVVPYGTMSPEQLRSAREALDAVSAPLLGTVMTMVPARRRRRDADEDAYLVERSELDMPVGERPVLAPAWTRTDDDPTRTNGFAAVTPSPTRRARPLTGEQVRSDETAPPTQ